MAVPQKIGKSATNGLQFCGTCHKETANLPQELFPKIIKLPQIGFSLVALKNKTCPVFYYLIVFAVIMVIGMFFVKEKSVMHPNQKKKKH